MLLVARQVKKKDVIFWYFEVSKLTFKSEGVCEIPQTLVTHTYMYYVLQNYMIQRVSRKGFGEFGSAVCVQRDSV